MALRKVYASVTRYLFVLAALVSFISAARAASYICVQDFSAEIEKMIPRAAYNEAHSSGRSIEIFMSENTQEGQRADYWCDLRRNGLGWETEAFSQAIPCNMTLQSQGDRTTGIDVESLDDRLCGHIEMNRTQTSGTGEFSVKYFVGKFTLHMGLKVEPHLFRCQKLTEEWKRWPEFEKLTPHR